MAKRIPEAQKLLILADAITTSAHDASTRWPVSEHTIYSWGDQLGGLRVLREVYEAHRQAAVSSMVRAISGEVQKRLPRLHQKAVVALAIQVLDSQARSQQQSLVTVNANANASAASAAGSVSAAEAAYIAALRGQPSTEGGESPELPPVQVSGNGAGGPEPAADHQ